MVDHITLAVHDAKQAIAFYAAALKPLGYEIVMEFGGMAGLGVRGKPDLWIAGEDATRKCAPMHVAFTAPDRKAVDAFYAAALAAGGKDNGKPGLRPDYHPTYYAAFVHDPDGHNIEAVCHKPE
jgi:catechol 2,3-dioxygenase-like lactoylglutathione lyase family enzyme